MISRRYRYVSKGGPASTGWGSIRPIVTPRTLALVEMSSIRAGTSFFSGTSRRITASGTVEDLRRKVEEYSALLAVMRRLLLDLAAQVLHGAAREIGLRLRD